MTLNFCGLREKKKRWRGGFNHEGAVHSLETSAELLCSEKKWAVVVLEGRGRGIIVFICLCRLPRQQAEKLSVSETPDLETLNCRLAFT